MILLLKSVLIPNNYSDLLVSVNVVIDVVRPTDYDDEVDFELDVKSFF